MTGKELYEQHVAERLERHDESPPKTVAKDGSLKTRKRPKFAPFERLPQGLQDGWNAKAATL